MSLTILPAAFAEMAQYPQFILYKLVPSATKPGKMDKLPVDWCTGQLPAKGAGGSAIWTDFASVAALAPLYGPDYGVGFSFSSADPFWFLDIDNCLQSDNTWSPTAMEVLAALPGCAIEISQSGRGLHLFGTGTVPDHGCKNVPLGLEFYSRDRFVALTGTGAMGDCRTDCTAALPGVITRWFPPSASVTVPSDWTTAPCPEWRGPADDAALIQRMMASRSNPFGGKATVQDLWTRNVEVLARAYPPSGNGSDPFDGSSADMALASHLAFWTGKDCARIERLMRMSGLVRDKYDRPDYLQQRTIPTAVAGCVNVYVEKSAVVEGVGTVPAAAQTASDVQGGTLASIDDQRRLFQGCVYVVSQHKVLVPGGNLLDAQRFNCLAPYNRFTYMLDASNERVTRKAFEALTNSQALAWPQAQGTCFRPELPPSHITEDGLVNTWWPIETASAPGGVDPFLEHLAKLLPDERDRNVLIAYAAALVQFPGDKFQWWPLLQGCQGNGKTLLLEALEHCVGMRYCHRPNASEIAGGGGKFTAWLDRKVLIGFEEVKTSHKSEVLEILKPIVTNNRIEIQGKGVDQFTGDNRANGILHSNHKDAIAVARGDRRYAVFYTAQQELAHLERDGMTGQYFPLLYKWLRHEGGLAHLNHWLRNYPIPAELNPALNNGGMCHRAPHTSSMDEAITLGMGKVEQEVLEAVAECKSGFCNGWISSIELDNLLREKRLDGLVPRIKRPDMLRSLGYVHHPGLHGGRATSPTNSGQRPVLYVREGHIVGQVQGGAAITRAYEAAQLPSVFGLDSTSRVA